MRKKLLFFIIPFFLNIALAQYYYPFQQSRTSELINTFLMNNQKLVLSLVFGMLTAVFVNFALSGKDNPWKNNSQKQNLALALGLAVFAFTYFSTPQIQMPAINMSIVMSFFILLLIGYIVFRILKSENFSSPGMLLFLGILLILFAILVQYLNTGRFQFSIE